MSELASVLHFVNLYTEKYNLSIHDHGPNLSDLIELFEKNLPWPQGNFPGVYTVYSDKHKLLYIGKASMSRHIGHRLYLHFQRDMTTPHRYRCAGGEEAWGGLPRYLYCFAVKESYEAPSLEEFLIDKLKPAGNTRGVPANF